MAQPKTGIFLIISERNFLRKIPDKLDETLITLKGIDKAQLLLQEKSLNSIDNNDKFSVKIKNLLDFLKFNEKTKISLAKEPLNPQPQRNLNYSLLDFKKIRDYQKQSKRNYSDVGVSPIKLPEQTFCLNISNISPISTENKSINTKENMDGSYVFKSGEGNMKNEETGMSLVLEKNDIDTSGSASINKFSPHTKAQLEAMRQEIAKYQTELEEKKNCIDQLQTKFSEQEQKLTDFNEKIDSCEVINKKNELLMEYLKEKEFRLRSCEDKIKDLQSELTTSESYRAILHSQIQELKGNLRIFCRVKPLNDPINSIILIPDMKNPHILELKNPTNAKSSYYFDHIFDCNSLQQEVFKEILPFVQSAIDGEQVSILAYGQTGSGKTFTLEGDGNYEGEESLNGDLRGIMPRSVEFIFNEKKRLDSIGKNLKFIFSIVEIYNENLTDLLNSGKYANILKIFPSSRLQANNQPNWKQGGFEKPFMC